MNLSPGCPVTDPRLFIWPKGADVAGVKQVVLDLDLGYSIKPFWYTAGVSEDAKRVLVLADGFENSPVVDYIYPKRPELLREAVEWALGIREEHPGARDSLATMQRIFGAELTMREEDWTNGE